MCRKADANAIIARQCRQQTRVKQDDEIILNPFATGKEPI